jgi:hypothetical protein
MSKHAADSTLEQKMTPAPIVSADDAKRIVIRKIIIPIACAVVVHFAAEAIINLLSRDDSDED